MRAVDIDPFPQLERHSRCLIATSSFMSARHNLRRPWFPASLYRAFIELFWMTSDVLDLQTIDFVV